MTWKIYQPDVAPAGTPRFWDDNWQRMELSSLRDHVRRCEADPLLPLFLETLRPERLFLEGGCGQAQWVRYFSERGYRAVGVDFAERTVEAVRALVPGLDVRVGNVLSLPFADGEIHTYYSGGVVEHFEAGPEPALREARRVIADDGWFLCSVPDESLLRNLLYRAEASPAPRPGAGRFVRRVLRSEAEPAPAGVSFYQYAFSPAEFTALLNQAGFAVVRNFSTGLLWGLMELPHAPAILDAATRLKRRLSGRAQAPDSEAQKEPPTRSADESRGGPSPSGGALRRALLLEDPSVPVVGPLARLVRERVGNMRMYVARPRV